MAFKTITILGGQGMLGTDLVATASKCGFDVRVYDLPEFDITDDRQLEEVVSDSEIIVNCAAYCNVDKAEREIELANQVNGYAVGRLGQIAKDTVVPVVHISTDFIFDGIKAEPYVETDIADPINAYGRSKLLGETLLAESGCDYCIVRLEWTYGKYGVSFITKILNAAKERDLLKVVNDQVGSPTPTTEVARVIIDLLQLRTFPTGIYHCAASGFASRYEIARFLFDTLGVWKKIEPCLTSDFESVAKRPLNSRFDCSKLETLLGRSMPRWQDMLRDYLETL